MYIVVTTIPPFNAISYGAIQFRLGEALVLLPFVMDEAVVGVAVGCLIANMFSPFGLIDLIVGTGVTLAAALLTRKLRTTGKLWLAALPPIVLNALVVGSYLPLVLPDYGVPVGLSILYVALGETVVLVLLGLPVLFTLKRISTHVPLFPEA